MKNKKASHVSLVLSFSMFIFFLIFIYVLVSASIIKEDTKTYALNQITENVLNQMKDNILTTRFYNKTVDCINVSLSQTKGDAIVFNFSGGIIKSNFDKGNVFFNGTGGFTKIIQSESLKNPSSFSPGICAKVINIGSQLNETRAMESKITSIIENVSSNYDSLKILLDISSNYEFDISFQYSNGTILGGKTKEPNVEVYSQEEKVFYLSSEGEDKNGILRVKIW